MDLAALASIGKYTALRLAVGTAVAKMTMDRNENQAKDLIQLMAVTLNPDLGQHIDTKV